MNDSVLAKFTKRPEGEAASPTENDESDDLGVFGWLRGVRDRAVMLELRHKDGAISALGYAWLERAEFNPSDGIVLHFAGKTVKITGRNLNAEVRPNKRLFTGITRHRVPWVQEADGPTAITASPRDVVIDEINVK